MPVSKKRKKKKQRSAPLPQQKNIAPKKKMSTQRILLYVISGVMILSLAASFIIGSTGQNLTPPPNVPSPSVEGDDLSTDSPAPAEESSTDEAPTEEATVDEESTDEAEPDAEASEDKNEDAEGAASDEATSEPGDN